MAEFNGTQFEENFEFNTNGTFTEGAFNNGTFNNGTFFNGTFNAEENATKIVPTSFSTPFIYGAILLISLFFFSRYYKQSQIRKLQQLKSIFDENTAKDLYYEIKDMQELNEVKIHEKVIKAALLNRGAEAIRRSFKMKELAPLVETIYKNGSVGEEYWKRFQTEVKLIEVEFKECIQEAELLQPGWAQLFVGLCQEICFNQALRRRYASILARRDTCTKEWDLQLDDNGRLKK